MEELRSQELGFPIASFEIFIRISGATVCFSTNLPCPVYLGFLDKHKKNHTVLVKSCAC